MSNEDKRTVIYIVLLVVLVFFLVTYNGPVLDEPGAPPTTQVAS